MTDGDRTAMDRLRSAVRRLRRWLFGRGGHASDGHGPRGPGREGVDPREGALQQRSQEKIDRLVELAEEKGEESDDGPPTGGPSGRNRSEE